MSSEVRDFLEIDKKAVDDMSEAELRAEVSGWRAVFALLPRENLEWMARLHDVVRFTRRNYQGSTGLLLGFKLEPTEFTIGLTETAFDTLHGERIIEDKVLVIPAAAVMYHEFIGDSRPFDSMRQESEIGAETLG